MGLSVNMEEKSKKNVKRRPPTISTTTKAVHIQNKI